MVSEVQSVIFSKADWTVDRAKQWLSKHGYKYGKVDGVYRPHFWSFRQLDPITRKKYFSMHIGRGIQLILMFNGSK
jgi:hypothetical protein